MSDFSKCKEGLHPFITISKVTTGILDEYKLVRWCPECGAIVVDGETDGRNMPGYYKKLTYPNLCREFGLNTREEFLASIQEGKKPTPL